MAPAYKLIYFDMRGLAEPIRYLFAQGGVEYEDVRIQKDQWPALKSNYLYGKLPILEVDGQKVQQSRAICSYVAKEIGLAGKDNLESLQIDSILDTFIDLRVAIMDAMHADEASKAQKKEKLLNETMPFYLSRLDETVKENGGYFANKKLSWADLYFASTFESIDAHMETKIIEQYPNLKALVEKIQNLPNIKAWREKRPKTQF